MSYLTPTKKTYHYLTGRKTILEQIQYKTITKNLYVLTPEKSKEELIKLLNECNDMLHDCKIEHNELKKRLYPNENCQ